jgi:hypothetical protein
MKIPTFSAQTEWVIPTEFPDLRQVDEIAIDLETRDPDLRRSYRNSCSDCTLQRILSYCARRRW